MAPRTLAVTVEAGGGGDGGGDAGHDTGDGAQYFRAHAHCHAQGKGAVAFSVSNSFDTRHDSDAPRSFQVNFGAVLAGGAAGTNAAASLGATRLDFLLQSANATAGIFSELVSLNGGSPLLVAPGDATGASAQLPPLEPRVVRGGGSVAELLLPPSTVGFVVFPNASLPACA